MQSSLYCSRMTTLRACSSKLQLRIHENFIANLIWNVTNLKISQIMSCEDSVILFANLAYIAHIRQNHSISLHISTKMNLKMLFQLKCQTKACIPTNHSSLSFISKVIFLKFLYEILVSF